MEALIEHDTGGGWSIYLAPAPPASAQKSDLRGVTCDAGGGCWAVGGLFSTSAGQQPLVEENTGSGWGIVPGPIPAGSNVGYLDSVTCLSTGQCWAVGSFDAAGTGIEQTLVEEETGSGWSIVTSPTPAQDAWLSGVTCTFDTDCAAVGVQSPASGPGIPAPLILQTYPPTS